ncbi:hypothetical protein N8T08_010436 [Aspergillus melleus]|uniref:Uncharacterized protein n=1 Tax=Aspergillus melleus TaxID=138277 RepID=A0ACC3ARL1_9EURO|nr:hypothetical protein N8T08_010436 [Aspergillus melleus]
MTSDPPPRPGLQPLSHLKAGPTTSSSKSTALPASSTLHLPSSPIPPRPRLPKAPSRDEQASATSHKATVALIRRVLCPQTGNHGGASTPQPPGDLLPPLTSSNEIDLQLYAIIAVIVKEFVLAWYSKITPDQTLVNEVTQVIAHCTRALEQRLRGTDVAQLFLDEVPALVEAHITSYRIAREQSRLPGFSSSTREIYHALYPHPAFSPVPDASDAGLAERQRANETVYRQLLAQEVLAVLLPTEDLDNVCLRTLVGDIVADLILGNQISGKMCEGWFLWESITKLLDAVGRQPAREDDTTTTGPLKHDQLKKFGLLAPKEDIPNHHSSKVLLPVPKWAWNVLHFGYLVYVTLRFIVTGLFRVATSSPGPLGSTASVGGHAPEAFPPCNPPGKRPVLDYRLYGMVSQLIDLPNRMPWLGGLLALSQYLILAGPGRLGDTDSVLDRFLHETIQNHLFPPTLLPNLLLASRAALFPLNARPAQAAAGTNPTGPPTPHLSVQPPSSPIERGSGAGSGSDAAGASNASSGISTPNLSATAPSLSPDPRPSAAEIASVKRRCAVSLLSRIPRPIARHFFGIPANGAVHGPLDSQASNDHDQSPRHPDSSRASSPVPPSPSHLTTTTAHPEEDAPLLAAIEHDLLDLFADEYCNKHLIYSIVEAILAKLLPELSERGLTELMEDRGVGLATAS